jgi:Holliday junction resolvasome RuvABC ATP-dependent DNA helicase subunit
MSNKPSKPEDAAGESDLALRPRSLADFVGQEKLIGHLAVYLGAARARAAARVTLDKARQAVGLA